MTKETNSIVKKKNFFLRFFEKIKDYFKKLFPLVMMQLKDKIDFSFLKSKKKTLFKIIYSILFFAVLTVIIYFAFYIIVNLSIFSFSRILNFRAYLVLMTILIALSFISCLVNTTKTLYFAKDNPVLLTMPVSNNKIFASKIVVIFVYELIKNATYILPFLVAYGIIMSLPFEFFIWAIFTLIIVTLFIVIISGLLSIPSMVIAISLKKHRIVQYFLTVFVSFGFVYGLVKLILAIPRNIDLIRDWGKIYWQIQSFLKNFSIIFSPFNKLLEFMTGMKFNRFGFIAFSGSNLLTLLFIVCAIIFGLLFIFLLSKPLFLKMASTPFEFKKVIVTKVNRNTPHKVFFSCVLEETRKIFRSNEIYSLLTVCILCPIAIFLQNQIVAAMNTRILGNYMTISFNILILLLILMSNSVNFASIYSKEGNSAYLNKVNPVNYSVLLSAKLVPYMFVSILSIIASCIVINIYANIGILSTIILCLSLIFVYVAHALWSAELDVMNPQNQQYQTTGSHQKNPNERLSLIICFAIAILFAFVTFFLIKENIAVVFVKLLFIGLILVLARIYLFYTKIKLYYKEK